MKAVTLKLELIGCWGKVHLTNLTVKVRTEKKKPWVAKIKGLSYQYDGLEREFIKPLGDFSEANSVKSRGAFFYFHLFDGCIYEIYEHITWKKDRRYFVWVHDGQLIEIEKWEIIQYHASAEPGEAFSRQQKSE